MLNREFPIDTSDMPVSEVLRCFQFGNESLNITDLVNSKSMTSIDDVIDLLALQQTSVVKALASAKTTRSNCQDRLDNLYGNTEKITNARTRCLNDMQDNQIKIDAIWAFKDNIRSMLVMLSTIKRYSCTPNSQPSKLCPQCGCSEFDNDLTCEIVTDGDYIFFEGDIGHCWCAKEGCEWSEKIGEWQSYDRARETMRRNCNEDY